ncbi:hypothetical protein J1605_002716 [Eschrichtius robustus]|uniref:Uncharacterized protein n=1 Tax=Eschrichtius robustus TaxID=9764 RepID=A0AB34HX77_ESCRO|nr:hypothetical protein J1605_002716 [Eschrichtius robustus]
METSIYIKLMHLPGGPALIFQTNTYTLVHVVVSSLCWYLTCFPINVRKANVNAVKHHILINYGPYSQELESRYYSMKVVAVARRYQYWASHNLQLIRTQEGVGEGNMLSYSFLHKTLEDLQATLVAKKEKLQLKAQREDRQAQNFQNK